MAKKIFGKTAEEQFKLERRRFLQRTRYKRKLGDKLKERGQTELCTYTL